MSRLDKSVPPAKQGGMMNAPKVRNRIVDNDRDSDGFWFYGYGNDPKRRRHIRHVEKQSWKKEVNDSVESCG